MKHKLIKIEEDLTLYKRKLTDAEKHVEKIEDGLSKVPPWKVRELEGRVEYYKGKVRQLQANKEKT